MRQVPKFFNTAGPIQPDIHYNIDPSTRIDLEELESLIFSGNILCSMLRVRRVKRPACWLCVII